MGRKGWTILIATVTGAIIQPLLIFVLYIFY